MTRQPIGLHAATHAPNGQDPLEPFIVTDGTTTVSPTGEILFDPEAFVVTDLGNDEAQVSLADYLSHTPVFSAISGSGTSPTIGGGGTAFGRYCKLNQFVHYYGSMLFGSGANPGTGLWQVDLPVPVSIPVDGESLGQANLYGITSVANTGKMMQFDVQQTPAGGFSPDASHIAFYYLSAYPFGNATMLDHNAPYTPIANGDILTWNIVYMTDT